MRASDYIGQTAYDQDGRPLGRVADLACHQTNAGQPVIDAVLVAPRHRGRMFGYERDAMAGPWLLEKFIEWLHRGTREFPIGDLVICSTKKPQERQT
jgi:GNAT superfamily N-acetyltransferase